MLLECERVYMYHFPIAKLMLINICSNRARVLPLECERMYMYNFQIGKLMYIHAYTDKAFVVLTKKETRESDAKRKGNRKAEGIKREQDNDNADAEQQPQHNESSSTFNQ